MKLQVVTNRGPVEVIAYRTGVPGLVVHRGHNLRSLWILTHEPSGMAVIEGFRKRKDAIEAAKLLSDEADWTRHKEELANQQTWDKIKRTYRMIERSMTV